MTVTFTEPVVEAAAKAEAFAAEVAAEAHEAYLRAVAAHARAKAHLDAVVPVDYFA